ncbi:MAG: hypothetical protein HFH90_06560 [Lachnospiraceae bacterium]|nr:hypothetical protein [Lachnospiraceae bacterium]
MSIYIRAFGTYNGNRNGKQRKEVNDEWHTEKREGQISSKGRIPSKGNFPPKGNVLPKDLGER